MSVEICLESNKPTARTDDVIGIMMWRSLPVNVRRRIEGEGGVFKRSGDQSATGRKSRNEHRKNNQYPPPPLIPYQLLPCRGPTSTVDFPTSTYGGVRRVWLCYCRGRVGGVRWWYWSWHGRWKSIGVSSLFFAHIGQIPQFGCAVLEFSISKVIVNVK
jgi:hypothetical protein